MKEKRNERHHYIPCFLLKHFSSIEGHLWMHRRGQPDPYPSSPTNAFVVKNLNRTVDENQTSDLNAPVFSFESEDKLSDMENLVAPIIVEILETIRVQRLSRPQLDREQTDLLKQFFLTMLRRTPEGSGDWLGPEEAYGATFRLAANRVQEQLGLEPIDNDVFAQPEARKAESTLRQNTRARYAAGSHPVVREAVRKFCRIRGLHLLVASINDSPRNSFVIGSRGVTIFSRCPGRKSAWFPIAPDLALSVTSEPGEILISHQGPNSDFVKELNGTTSEQSAVIAGHSKALVRAIPH